jgi:hypothetical protein
MKGERIEAIFIPNYEDWIVLKTNSQYYSLRLGGFINLEQIELAKYNNEDLPLINKTISKVYTDDFLILIETIDGDAMKHSPYTSIDNEGVTSFGISYLTSSNYTK